MTKIRVCSDLHLEFTNGNYNLPVMEDEHEQVLCYAGDLGVADRPITYCSLLEEWESRFKKVLYVCGNHEHYSGSILRSEFKIRRNLDFELGDAALNIETGDTFTVTIDDTAFICATMWSSMGDGNPACVYEAETFMNDYRKIRSGPSVEDAYKWKLKPIHTMAIHKRHLEFIFKELAIAKAKGLKTVVMTHHAPSFQSASPNYVGNSLNGAYMTEIYNQYDMEQPMPDIHIHGHVHDSFDYMLDQTRVVCNPRGYFPSQVNPKYNAELVIEL